MLLEYCPIFSEDIVVYSPFFSKNARYTDFIFIIPASPAAVSLEILQNFRTTISG